MVNMFGMIVGATLIPLVYWFLRTIFFYSGVSEAAPGYNREKETIPSEMGSLLKSIIRD